MNGKQFLDHLLEESYGHDTHKHDHVAKVGDYHFSEESRLIVPQTGFGEVPPLEPTEWAYRQLFKRLGISESAFGRGSKKSLPADYFFAIPDDLRAQLLNRHIGDFPNGGELLVRAYDDYARACLSGRYAVIDNTEVLELFRSIVEAEADDDFQLVRSSVTADTLHVKSVWRDTGIGDDGNPEQGGGGFGVGLYIGNNETGRGKWIAKPLLQRTSCTNSIVFDYGGFEFRHVGDATVKRVEMKAVLADLFPKAADLLNKMIAAHDKEIPAFGDVLAGLAKEYDWSEKVKIAVAAGTENQHTLAGLVNGVTFAAHDVHRDDPDAQVELETLGGSLLVHGTAAFAARGERAFVRYERIGRES